MIDLDYKPKDFELSVGDLLRIVASNDADSLTRQSAGEQLWHYGRLVEIDERLSALTRLVERKGAHL